MTRRLWLLRHGKSDWHAGTPDDFDRPLAKRGGRDAARMGEWLAARGPLPDHVVSSPAQRARQTTLAVCGSLGIGKRQVFWDTRIYEAPLDQLLEVLADCPASATCTLLVGHNPGLDELLMHLSGGHAEADPKGKLMTTAALAELALPDDWSVLPAGCAELIIQQRPRDL
ncbi:MAG: histidine phosphatase family protein [Gammaproteobacteria bacterium]|nr:histidine phosphatase family protein [Gammaproteobacteria bacterium]